MDYDLHTLLWICYERKNIFMEDIHIRLGCMVERLAYPLGEQKRKKKLLNDSWPVNCKKGFVLVSRHQVKNY